MFALRGTAVSLTFFVLSYCLLSALVVVAWRWLKLLRVSEQSQAALLVTLRILPLAASIIITFGFVVPSFQLLEPRSIDEGLGTMPLVFGICALVLIACGCFRVIVAYTKSSRVVARWLEGARPLNAGPQNVAFRSPGEIPPLTLVGVRKPRVLVSESTVAVLTHDELHIALRHEHAHMRARDNLKKLVFRFCPFPGMATLESAWSYAAELAADDAAVSNLDDALDLAAALVKLSRLLPVEAAPFCTVGFATGPVSARVARLLAWDEAGEAQPARLRSWHWIPLVLLTLSCVFITYGRALAMTHEATEWLVR
jgi:Zn-dependent protease with chaperone function